MTNSNNQSLSALYKFKEMLDYQNKKGLAKYGQPLNPMDNYDWTNMALEENIDQFQYLYAEQVKKKYVINEIREIIRYNVTPTVHDQINSLLDLLEGKRK